MQHEILLCVARSTVENGAYEVDIASTIKRSLARTQFELRVIENQKMATDGDEPDYGAGRQWVLMEKGSEYLAERDLL